MTGTPNNVSSSAITVGGNADDDERMKRNRLAETTSTFLEARVRIAWCMVGTAVYQVGRASAIQEKNFSALNPGEQHTAPPAESGASKAAMRPWMWNSGMMQRPWSRPLRASVSRTLRAEVQTFCCDSGTIFGLDVVPEVCSTSAMSVAPANRVSDGCAVDSSGNSSTKLPAPRSGV